MGHPAFSDDALIELLRALRARRATRPDNSGLLACWPAVREQDMAAACAELIRRGHPVMAVALPGHIPGTNRRGWTVVAAP
jgi:hypothetical protein